MLSWQVRQARVRRERQLELARLEAERQERERQEAERRERERLEAERRERERVEAERKERERIEAERLRVERQHAERREAARQARLEAAVVDLTSGAAVLDLSVGDRARHDRSNTLARMSTASTPLGGPSGPAQRVKGGSDGTDGRDGADADVLEDAERDHLELSDAEDPSDAAPTEADELRDEDLGDELDAELEAEVAEMAPLVELPDHAPFASSADGDTRPNPAVEVAPVPGGGKDVTVRLRGQGRVPARKVRRVIRRVDPLSVLKLSFAFNLCLFAMFGIAAVLLWSAAIGSGSTDNIESFVVDIGFDNFKLVGADLFRGFLVFGSAMVIAGTVFAVLMALLFNLISDVVGGIRLTVIEPQPPPPATSDVRTDADSQDAGRD